MSETMRSDMDRLNINKGEGIKKGTLCAVVEPFLGTAFVGVEECVASGKKTISVGGRRFERKNVAFSIDEVMLMLGDASFRRSMPVLIVDIDTYGAEYAGNEVSRFLNLYRRRVPKSAIYGERGFLGTISKLVERKNNETV